MSDQDLVFLMKRAQEAEARARLKVARPEKLARNLNRPMVRRLLDLAEDLGSGRYEAVKIYPVEARQLVALIDAAQSEGEDQMPTDNKDRMEFVIGIINQFIPDISFSRGGQSALTEAVKEQAKEIVERWEQDMTNAAVRARLEDKK